MAGLGFRGSELITAFRGDPYVTRGQVLLASLRGRFPGHEISAGFIADLSTIIAWRYSALPHEPAALMQLEQEWCDSQTS